MPVNRSVPDVAQKRKDWNGLISGFKASGLTDGSRAVSTKKEDPLSELQLREGVFFLVSQMTSSISTFTIYSICHPPQKSSAVQKVYKHSSLGIYCIFLSMFMIYWFCGSSPLSYGRGGEIMDYILTLLVSVAANVVSHFICKWLDR